MTIHKTLIFGFSLLATALNASAETSAEYVPASSMVGALPGGTRLDAQTFTAQIGGKVSRVDIALNGFGSFGSGTVISLLSTFNGVPLGLTSGLLGSITVSAAQIPVFGSSGYLEVDFSPIDVLLEAGKVYAIAVGGADTKFWLGTDGGYSGGSMYTSFDSGQKFVLFPTQSGDRDLAFKVDVIATSVPDASGLATGIVGAMFVGALVSVRRKQTRVV